jgi:pyridoxal phosphate enzyme (YggS family)
VDCCGENRVQELVQKQPLGAYEGRPVHFIGHLQTNKVKQVVGKVDLIQSVDREDLLACIQKTAEKMGLVQNILLEVNIGNEESKSGFTPAEVLEMAGRMGEFPNCRLKGLMAIPPVCETEGGNAKYFAEMQQLLVDISAKKYDNVTMECLSMGMSGDYADAIRHGSTMIRVGTAIFGPRNYG